MAQLSRRKLAQEVTKLLIEQPTRRTAILRGAAAYLVQHKKTHEARLFMLDIADELYKNQGALAVEVRSAFGLTGTSREHIVRMLQKTMGAKTVELTEIIEPELIGGVVIRTPNAELDASVKRQLTQLAGGTN